MIDLENYVASKPKVEEIKILDCYYWDKRELLEHNQAK
jgi:hypothetical protein